MDDDRIKEKLDDIKTKAKSMMKNWTASFGSAARGGSSSSSSQAFQGQGHRLGGSAEPAGAPSNGGGGCMARKLGPGFNEQIQQQSDFRRLQQERWARERGVAPAQPYHIRETSSAQTHRTQTQVIQSGATLASAAASVKSPTPDSIKVEREPRGTVQVGNLAPAYSSSYGSGPDNRSHFDPYSPIIASGTSHRPSVAGNRIAEPQGQVQCPICQKWWQSEAQVSAHIDDCTRVGQAEFSRLSIAQEETRGSLHQRAQEGNAVQDIDDAVAIFLAGGPSKETIEVILRIFRDILNNPTEDKYRKLRLGKQKIKETIGSAIGGLKFLESVGFRLAVEGQEKCLLMEQPSIEQKQRIQAAIAYLDSYYSTTTAPVESSLTSQPATKPPSTFNRQLRVFYPSQDHPADKFEVPAAFYNLSATEVRNEAANRRKMLQDSQLLIPKSLKEKQAAIAKRRYKATVVRVQLPDGLVIQGFFKPGEPTSSLYEFVASTLKDGSETFDLVLPPRHRVVPCFPEANGHCPTMEEADLVPMALLKFSPTGPQGYTCLKTECYALCEPL